MNPEFFLLVWAIGLLIFEACRSPEKDPRLIGQLAMVGIALTLAATWLVPAPEGLSWKLMYQSDPLAIFFKRLFLVVAFFVAWMSLDDSKRFPLSRGEFFIFPLFTTVGLMLLASAADMIVIFVALELVTISFYVLVAFQRDRTESLEAGVKYLIIGGLSTAFLVYGLAFLYGGVESLSFTGISSYLVTNPVNSWILFGMVLVLIGIGFKLAAVPFHAWAPDVYQGAPTPVTAFLATGSKAAAVLVLVRLFTEAGAIFRDDRLVPIFGPIFAGLAIASMVLGSLAALPQRNLKRLLGYSSIGHAGFILVGFSCYSDAGNAAVLMYLGVYVLSALLAFFIMARLSSELGGDDIQNYAGLGRRSPLMALGLAVAFVSMAGLPPLAGFLGKLGVLGAAWLARDYILFGVVVFCAVAALYYYLNIVRAMYWQDGPSQAKPVSVNPSFRLGVIALILLVIGLGFYPLPLSEAVEQAIPGSRGGQVLAETIQP
ncbi:MAG: NADH-quinone oxidoreductase subunit N [Candidatus Methylacidiphilales bacterium]